MCKSKFQICHLGIQKTGIKNFTLRIEYTFIGNYMESVRITDPGIRFGILQIGVGSSKKEVMLAYGLKKTLSNEEENEYAVQNGLYSTSFYFDENDRVYKIACGRGV